MWEAHVDWGRHPQQAEVEYRKGGETWKETHPIQGPADVFDFVLRAVKDPVDRIGHRVVDGGGKYAQAVRVDAAVKASIEEMAKLAPAHNKIELAGIAACERVFGPDKLQAAVFDTAFHASLAPAAYTYPGPYSWVERGIRRLGFHGTSHKYVTRRAAELLGRPVRAVSCHLGNGCSLAAVDRGRSVDTTMGFTPLEGVMMGTRSGSIDPTILIYLAREDHATPDDLDRILNKESGLKGVSGISGDLREIHQAIAAGNKRAKLAWDIFIHRLVREIGGMVAVLGGLDALVFTAGMGEHDAELRAAVCGQLGFLGIAVDAEKNAKPDGDADVSQEKAPVRTLMVRTQEEWQIALETAAL